MGNDYERLIKAIMSPFLSHPEDIEVIVASEDRPNIQGAAKRSVTLRVHRTDQPMVIGGGARMVKAVTVLLRAAAFMNNETIWFEVVEPVHGATETRQPFEAKQDWGVEQDNALQRIMESVCEAVLPFGCDVQVESVRHKTFISLRGVKTIPIQLVAALGTVFRSIGKGMGRPVVSVHVE